MITDLGIDHLAAVRASPRVVAFPDRPSGDAKRDERVNGPAARPFGNDDQADEAGGGLRRASWFLGTVIASVAVGLYMVQQTVGLPGLPKNWWEPSRIVSLAVQALLIIVAICQVRHRRHETE